MKISNFFTKSEALLLIFANAKLQSFAIGNRALMFASLTCAIYFLLDSLAIEYYKYARRKERGLIRRETYKGWVTRFCIRAQ